MGKASAGMAQGIRLLAPVADELQFIVADEALDFVAALHRAFDGRRRELLAARDEKAARIASGAKLGFLDETQDVRTGDWPVAPAPADLNDRRVEITGPCDRKMLINTLNSGARVFMADLEDASSPTWHNVLDGQRNLIDAVRRTISFRNPDGREYRLAERTATLLVRPRGWHLPERHVLVDGEPVAGSLFDFCMYLSTSGQIAIDKGFGPYFYLPKME